jgi:phenylalanyl-tRNA synthetase alpha chain
LSDTLKLDGYSPEDMQRFHDEVLRELDVDVLATSSADDLRRVRDKWLGRKAGKITQLSALIKTSPPDARRAIGGIVNEIKAVVENQLDKLQGHIASQSRVSAIDSERLDISLPGIRRPLGAEHAILRTMEEFVGVFKAMGYSVESGPEIETDWFNFEALNFAENHPARDMADTIFVAGQQNKRRRDQLLLRTHTSPVQIRSMMKTPPPIRVVCPGKVFRHDAPDATHSPMFHQIEALAVDTNIKFSDLKGSLDHAMKMLYGSSVKTRFQPSFFPFTEPSAEIYISCPFCSSKGCRICKQSGWIEMGGSGMVHPNVFRSVAEYGYDPEKVSGFAFGMGVDRLAALRWGIDDIQLFFQGDVRFLEQFA